MEFCKFHLLNPILCEVTFLPFYSQYCSVLDGGKRLYETPSLHIITCRNNLPVVSYMAAFHHQLDFFGTWEMRYVFKPKSVRMPAHLCASFKNKKLGGNHSTWRTPFLPRSETLKLEYSDPIWDSGTNTISCALLYLSATAAASWNGSRCRTESSNPPPLRLPSQSVLRPPLKGIKPKPIFIGHRLHLDGSAYK